MPHRNEQPTLFELTGVDEFELPRGLPREQASRSVTPKSGSSTPEVNGSFREPGVFRAVSPLTTMTLREVCAACGREITGSGFVILDCEDLGAFCHQACGDKRFRSYLYEAPDEGAS